MSLSESTIKNIVAWKNRYLSNISLSFSPSSGLDLSRIRSVLNPPWNAKITSTSMLQTSREGHFGRVNSREIFFEVTIYQSQDILRNLNFFFSSESEKNIGGPEV